MLFVSFDNPNSIGITRKLELQKKYLELAGAQVNGVIINNVSYQFTLPEDWKLIKYKTVSLSRMWNRRYLRDFKPFIQYLFERRNKINALKRIVDNYDVIYLRYPCSDFFLYNLMKKKKHVNWFFEHNSIEILELELYKTTWSDSKFALKFENWFGQKCLHKTSGIIGVTKEIVNYNLSRIKGEKPSFVLGNGIEIKEGGLKKIQKKNTYQGIFLVGSFTVCFGLDILPELIKQSKNRLELTVVGEIPEELKSNLVKSNITVIPKVDFKILPEFLKEFDFGIGTLALNRVNMVEAASLKTREYLCNDLPVLINYFDTDLSKVPGVFNWGGDEKVIEELIRFLDEEKRINSEILKNTIGMRYKMEMLYKFINNSLSIDRKDN